MRKLLTTLLLLLCVSTFAQEWTMKADLKSIYPDVAPMFKVVAQRERGVIRDVAVNAIDGNVLDGVQFTKMSDYLMTQIGSDNGSGDGTWERIEAKRWSMDTKPCVLMATYLVSASPQEEHRYLYFYEYNFLEHEIRKIKNPLHLDADERDLRFALSHDSEDIAVYRFGELWGYMHWGGNGFDKFVPSADDALAEFSNDYEVHDFALYDQYNNALFQFPDIEHPKMTRRGVELNIVWNDDKTVAQTVSLRRPMTNEVLFSAKNVVLQDFELYEAILRPDDCDKNVAVRFSGDFVDVYVDDERYRLRGVVNDREHAISLPSNANIVDYFNAIAPLIHPSELVVRKAQAAIEGATETTTRTIDLKNGYIAFTFGLNEDLEKIETCYWRMANGKSLVAVYFMERGCSDYVRFFVVDKTQKTARQIQRPFELAESKNFCGTNYALPQHGKTINVSPYGCFDNDIYLYKATFNGTTFDVKETVVKGD